MEEAHDYRFGPVLDPDAIEPTDATETAADGAPGAPDSHDVAVPEVPVQGDMVQMAETAPSIKPQLRQEMRARRDALTDRERNAATRRIVERLLHHPDVHRAKTVLLYAHHGSEVATDELAKDLIKRGKAVAYPKMTAVAGLMTLWRVRNLDALVPHKHGIRAPDVTRSAPIEPISVDCVIYPGLAFTKGLARLGQGGGYYDRLSGKLADNCARIGVCFETQIADQLPEDEHDARMHWVVTEATVYPFVPDPPVIAPVAVPAASTDGATADGTPAESATPLPDSGLPTSAPPSDSPANPTAAMPAAQEPNP
ncbi:MAG: 5-formyltetrahydrofolate cyclo-ligase [Burkholderiales bacterium]|nr:5-formyltetrahydrofolate cyclo-ligase [Burkholderiales bacterium]